MAAKAVKEDAQVVVDQLAAYSARVREQLAKQKPLLESYYQELIALPANEVTAARARGETAPDPILTVTAQCLIEKEVAKLKSAVQACHADHRNNLHRKVHQCGKDLEKLFQTDLTHILKNEKDLEENVDNRQVVNRLLYDFFVDTGMADIADTLRNESELPIESKRESEYDELQQIMEYVREKNLAPIIKLLETDPRCLKKSNIQDVLFNIHRQHVLFLVQQGKQTEALIHSRKLQVFAADHQNEIAQLMTAVVSYPDIDRYSDLFHENRWHILASELQSIFGTGPSSLETLLGVGATALPSLLEIKSILMRSIAVNSDELPITIPIPQPVHSTFTCPILRTQSSETNPPVRLGCGHVISKDAVTKLSANNVRFTRSSRHNRQSNGRMKCPYCPEEINTHENKQLRFN